MRANCRDHDMADIAVQIVDNSGRGRGQGGHSLRTEDTGGGERPRQPGPEQEAESSQHSLRGV